MRKYTQEQSDEVVFLYKFTNLNQKQISERVGVSEVYVSRTINKRVAPAVQDALQRRRGQKYKKLGKPMHGFYFVHQKVMCEHLGLDKMPKGYCVHHIDGNTFNNDLSNLVMMTRGAHKSHHMYVKKHYILKRVEPD